MKKIGIFLGFGPNISIKTEGIGRLIAFLIEGNLVNNKVRFVIAIPKWFKKNLLELLDDQNISLESIDIITTKNIPLIIKIFNLYKKYKKRRIRKKRFDKSKLKLLIVKIVKRFDKLFDNLISSRNFTYLLINLLPFIPLILILVIVFLLILLISVCTSIFRLVYKLFITPINEYVKNNIIKLIKKAKVKKWLLKIGIDFDIKEYRRIIYEKLIHVELLRLTNIINGMHEINVWYIPSMFWPEISNIKAKKVVAAPDIVYYDFPSQFSDKIHEITHEKIRDTLISADHVICYCNYVKYNHLINKCGINEKNISVIKHANINLSRFLNMKESINKYMNQKQRAIQILNKYKNINLQNNIYLKDIDFESLQYVFFSSQLRPHKNIFNLIKAVNIISKRYYKNIKLILTANIEGNKDIINYIKKNDIEYDVIQMYDIPSDVLASIYKLATCAVNPTMFEGGFPFTFSEAYSLGVPSIMSDIPVIRDEINDEELEKLMLFDPYNPYDMAKKIIWGVENRELLFMKQNQLYNKLGSKNWQEVSEEYIDTFRNL